MHNYKKQLLSLFSQFAMTVNMPTKSNWSGKENENDYLKLDYNPVYGGYKIVKVLKNTGEADFNTTSRRTTKEMIAFIQGFISCNDRLYHK